MEQAVLAIWNFFRRVCGKRLVPMIRENLDALFAGKKLNLPPQAKAKTAQVAAAGPEFRVLKNKARKWTEEVLEDIRSSFPVALKGIDSA